jgi:membrane-associated protein
MTEINWLDAQSIITVGGFLLIALTVFAESGIFFLFFLPGDYLLFSAGLLCSPKLGVLPTPIHILCITLFIAAVLGNFTGYFFGKYLGHTLENRKENFFFKQQYIHNTRAVFEKHGGVALVVARFLPVVRTFAPILAGITRLNWVTFTVYNMLGAAIWVLGLCLAGYYLGEAVGSSILDYLHYIIFGFIGVTGIIAINGFRRLGRKKKD